VVGIYGAAQVGGQLAAELGAVEALVEDGAQIAIVGLGQILDPEVQGVVELAAARRRPARP